MRTATLIYMFMLAQSLCAQSFSETVSKELTFEKRSPDNALIVANLFGSVKVVAYQGEKILVEARKSIYAKTDARLAQAKEEILLSVIDRADTLIIYVRDGCHEFARSPLRTQEQRRRTQFQYLTTRDDCNLAYDYKMDFIIKVPASVNIDISTINDGDLVVENMQGAVKASNVNGSVRLTNLQGSTNASTINGDVDIEYGRNPATDCRFYTLNGNINAVFQPGLSANIDFRTFNGDLYTNILNLQNLPVTVEKTNQGEALKYRIGGNRFRAGNGGALLHFETFNGGAYLKEKKN